MRVTTIDRYRPEPGELVVWSPGPRARAAAATAPPSPVPASFNQRFHLETARRRGSGAGTWLALAFDLPGRADPGELEAAFLHWVRRHDTLRSGFRERAGAVERFVLAPAELDLARADAGPVTSADELRDRLDATCDPLAWPSYVLTAILRPDRTTVLCGFDHCDADGYSLAIAVHELRTLYLHGAADLPAPGSFLDYCAAEQADPAPGPADPALARWREFLGACGGTTPGFPFDLGVEPGWPAAQATGDRPLLDAAGTQRFELACRALGGSVFTGVLTAAGLAARGLGGPDVLRLFTPLHTRTDPRWEHAIGWLTTVAPLALPTGAGTFADVLPRVHDEFRSALGLGRVRVPHVLAAAGTEFRRTRDDVFMLSYTDYRKFPGAEWHTEANARHISNVTVADDAQFWFSRTHEGLFLRSRYPDTAIARRTVGSFVDTLAANLG